ncbi:hypothetical protein LIER_06595 [Lithospermum erythrorhizon]|uniref:Uncharacterized protein n=1 Tax=Lithospermum erythrorhizon TaxID=34254 RepID=A0AAV3P8V4_LITER
MNQQSGTNTCSQGALLQEFIEQEQSCKKHEERIRNLEMKAVQNVNIFFVFQAVILGSTSKSGSTLKCQHWWIPFVLSLLASIFNLIAFSEAMFQVLKSRTEVEQSLADLALMKMYSMPKASLTQVLPGTPLAEATSSSGGSVVRRKPELSKMVKLHLMVYLSILSFLGFSGIIMYGTRLILC